MQKHLWHLLCLCLLVWVSCASNSSDPSYDHQRTAYTTSHHATTVTRPTHLTVTPYFSPVASTPTIVKLIQSATTSVDIGTPGFSSWSGCTPFDNNTAHCVKACTPAAQRSEDFPVFQALLNLLHKGNVKVRILTNDYQTPDCEGTISPLPFLVLNGARVSYFNSVTFLHTKFIVIDGIKMSISSINFSRTSFTRNREAGAVISGSGALPLIKGALQVFDADFRQGNPLQVEKTAWNSSDLATIVDKTPVQVVLPKPSPTQSSYFNPPTPVPIDVDSKSVTVGTSPDFSSLELMRFIGNATKSLDVMIYQITGQDIVDKLISLKQNGVSIRLLVSSTIFGRSDCELANRMYPVLISAGIPVSKTTRHYTYSHQKFWIVDGHSVGWSTGNWGPSDFPANSNANIPRTYPPYDQPGWQKLNRDFTVYVQNDRKVTAAFQAVFDGDSDPTSSFPSKVYPWDSNYPVSCGSGN